MRLDLLDWATAKRDFAGAWESILTSRDFNLSLHPNWLECSLSAWGLVDQTTVAAIETEQGHLSLIPFSLRKRSFLGIGLVSLELSTNVVSYHAEIVSGGDLERALEIFLTDRRLPHWDVFRLDNLPS